jgi:hypothetical protein
MTKVVMDTNHQVGMMAADIAKDARSIGTLRAVSCLVVQTS